MGDKYYQNNNKDYNNYHSNSGDNGGCGIFPIVFVISVFAISTAYFFHYNKISNEDKHKNTEKIIVKNNKNSPYTVSRTNPLKGGETIPAQPLKSENNPVVLPKSIDISKTNNETGNISNNNLINSNSEKNINKNFKNIDYKSILPIYQPSKFPNEKKKIIDNKYILSRLNERKPKFLFVKKKNNDSFQLQIQEDEKLPQNNILTENEKKDNIEETKVESNTSENISDDLCEKAYNFIKDGKLFNLFDLVSKGYDLSKMNYKGMTAPCIAAEYEQFEIMKYLLHEYDCKNLVDSVNGKSALHYAVIYSKKRMAVFLLSNGFDINCQDSMGNTPLHSAIEKCSVGCVEILLNRFAKTNIQNSKNQTPLHLAILNNYTYIVELLLKKGADTNIQDIDGNTPLHYMAKIASPQSKRTLESLFRYKEKFNLEIKNKDGKTPRNIMETDCFALYEENK